MMQRQYFESRCKREENPRSAAVFPEKVDIHACKDYIKFACSELLCWADASVCRRNVSDSHAGCPEEPIGYIVERSRGHSSPAFFCFIFAAGILKF